MKFHMIARVDFLVEAGTWEEAQDIASTELSVLLDGQPTFGFELSLIEPEIVS